MSRCSRFIQGHCPERHFGTFALQISFFASLANSIDVLTETLVYLGQSSSGMAVCSRGS